MSAAAPGALPMPDPATAVAVVRMWQRGMRHVGFIARVLRIPATQVWAALDAAGLPQHRHDRRTGRTRATAPRGVTKRAVLARLEAGETVRDIAQALGVRVNTVRFHVRTLGPLIDALDALGPAPDFTRNIPRSDVTHSPRGAA